VTTDVGQNDAVGAWGTGIFSDDTASDVRSDYRSLLESGVDDAHAMREILRTYTPDDTVVWLALAAAQSKLGRLDPTVAARALEVIDTDEDLEHWMDTEPKERRGRRRALARLRQTLTGPQPERQEVKLQWRHHTDLEVGDVLELSTESVSTLWAVVASDPGALGTHPMIRRLRYAGRRPSSAQEVFDRTRSGEIIAEPGWDEIWGVRMRSRDSDWTGPASQESKAVVCRCTKALRERWVASASRGTRSQSTSVAEPTRSVASCHRMTSSSSSSSCRQTVP